MKSNQSWNFLGPKGQEKYETQAQYLIERGYSAADQTVNELAFQLYLRETEEQHSKSAVIENVEIRISFTPEEMNSFLSYGNTTMEKLTTKQLYRIMNNMQTKIKESMIDEPYYVYEDHMETVLGP